VGLTSPVLLGLLLRSALRLLRLLSWAAQTRST
jgi:hypothetical protein